MRPVRALAIASLTVVVACSTKPASVDISPKRPKLYGLERTQRLSARILDKKGEPLPEATAEWSSSDPAVAHVEAGGRVIAKKEGKAMITASYKKVSAQVPVEVVDVSAVEVTPASLNLIGPAGVQIPLQVTVKNSKDEAVPLPASWESSDEKIATVSEDGVVTSVRSGTATIVARVGDLQGGAEVRVAVKELASLDLRPKTALVRVGDSQTFQVVAYGPDGGIIEGVAAQFESSDPAVAVVDAGGKVSGASPGTATIQARLGTITAQATLLVN
ncbi:MAG: Ig-like domain-containing protein [Thermoanaerobaculia bacterium]